MSAKGKNDPFVANPQEVAGDLLEPVLRFLQQSGISRADAERAFQLAWASAARQHPPKVRLASLTDPQPFVDLVATWCRNPRFLDKTGLPRSLTIRGRGGFASLVREVAPSLEVNQALKVLVAYGNVERLRSGHLKLLRPFFHIRTDNRLAFEPSVRFLVDAAGNVKSSLAAGPRENAGGVRHFWRAVETRTIPRRRVRHFLQFVKDQSLTFLQDIDDWLAQNSQTKSRSLTRVGVGMFTFGSSTERE